MLEEGSRELAKMLEKHPHLLESFEGWDEIQSVVRRLAGQRPVVGNKYCILNLTISPPGKFLIQQGSSEPLELVGINDRGSYLQYEFDAGDRIIQYPEDHRAGDQLSKTFLYRNAQELEKMQNFISLSLSGWEIRNRISENFADGKVKGKSRPGRVKRAGASCKGSVTDLRARAKKYGGERGRMYHWCANMKSGRQRTNEDNAGTLTIGPVKIVVDLHAVDRAIDRGISPDTVDIVLRRLPLISQELDSIESGSRIWVYSPEHDIGLGMRRISSGELKFVLKTLWHGRPMDLNVAKIIQV